MKYLIQFCGKKTLSVLFFASFVTLFLDLLSIALIFPFLKIFISPEIIHTSSQIGRVYKVLNFEDANKFIVAVGLLLVSFYFLRLSLKILLNKIKYQVSNDVTFRLTTYLFKGLLNSKYSLFTEQSTSEMVGIVNAHTIHGMICLESWIIILNEIFFLIFLFIAFIFFNPMVSFILIAAFAFLGWVMYLGFVKRISEYGLVHSQLNMLVYKFAFAVANSIKDIKIMGLENQYLKKFSEIWKEYSTNDSKSKTAKGIPKDVSETLIFSGIILVCLYVLVTHQNLMELIPVLGVVAVSAMRVLPSFNRIISNYNEYKYYRNSLGVVEDLSQKIEKNKQEIQYLDLLFKEKIEIRNLSFSFGDKRVLDSISITVPKGKSIAIVGSSGAGKSTFLDLLVGLREAETGEYRLDGRMFDPFRTDALRRLVGYVPQIVNLIDESIAFNISFEREYDKEKMAKVIKSARLSEFISELALGVETIIGEGGVRVSGGQKQRIGIARALYRDPEILIFDEATSSLDNITERELMDEINLLSGLKTLIIVAHRLTTVEKCDEIYLLGHGRILAHGSHFTLLSSCSEYHNLYEKQSMNSGH